MKYRVNAPQVLYEAFDDEMVIINLDSGSYYTLNDTGRVIWEIVSAGGALEQALAALSARFEDISAEQETRIHAFVQGLVDEELIVVDTLSAGQVPINDAPRNDQRRAYIPPALEKYTDMQELLLLDPIHEVDEQGWPVAKADR